MASIRLTVGITYHDEKDLLTSCLLSLLPQLNETDEVLVYDDASHFPAKDYVPASPLVRVIRSENNLGPAKARNRLAKEARGEYLHFHDSDDWFHADWAKRVSSHFGKTDVVITEVTSYREEKRYLEKVMEVSGLNRDKDLLKFAIEGFILVPSGTYRKSLFDQVRGYQEVLWQSEDWDFHVRMALEKPSFAVIEEPLVYIRIRDESRSQNVKETSTDTLKAISALRSQVPKEYTHFLSDKAAKMGSKLFIAGHFVEAKKAFQLASDLGPSDFHWQRASYRWIAKCLGQETAERVAMFYRKCRRPSVSN